MSNQPKNILEDDNKQGAIKLIGLQFLTTVLVSSGVAVVSLEKAQAWLTGSLIAIVANAYFSWRFFNKPATDDFAQETKKVIGAEMGKFLLVVIFFAVAFKTQEPLKEQANALTFFAAFLVIYLQSLAAPRLMKWTGANRKMNSEK